MSVRLTPAEHTLYTEGATTPSENGIYKERLIPKDFVPPNPSEVIVIEGPNFEIRHRKAQGIFFKIGYYFGFHHENSSELFAQHVRTRKGQLDEFLSSPAPGSLREHRHICCRAQLFSKEVMDISRFLKMDGEHLEQSTNNLFFLARWVCQFVQWTLGHFRKGKENQIEIQQHLHTMIGKDEGLFNRTPGTLEQLIRGKYNGSSDVTIGVKIGETQVDGKSLGVYAYPETGDDHLTFTGRTLISLSVDGKNYFLANFFIERIWNKDNGTFDPRTGENWLDNENSKILTDRRLYIYHLDALDSDTPDRKYMRKLVQVAAEILYREGEKSLELNNSHSNAYVLACAGFDSTRDGMLKQKIFQARVQGKTFPDPVDEGAFRMTLSQDHLANDEVTFELGKGMTSWKTMIENHPILFGKGPVLPHYYARDFHLREKNRSLT